MTMGVGISARLRAVTALVLACAAASFLGPSARAMAAAGGPATVTVSDITVTEGNPGSTVVATFTLKVNKRASGSLTYATANGSLANMKLGARDFLIQQNWVNASGGYCAKSY